MALVAPLILNPVFPIAEAYTPTLQERALEIAAEYEISTTTLFNLIESESQWGEGKISKTGDYGLVQINLGYNPTVSKEEALDPEFSIRWAADKISKGETWRFTSCSCTQFVRAVSGYKFPRADAEDFYPNTTVHVGAVAIFKYRKNHHIGYVTSLNEKGFTIREANYKPCKTGTRFISWTDPHLVGFWRPSLAMLPNKLKSGDP